MRHIALFILIGMESILASAQITLEHTFSSTGSMYYYVNTNDQTMYYNIPSDSILNLYNDDFSFYKSITITPPAGFKKAANGIGSISTKVFNDDNLVEFTVYFQTTSTSNPYESKLLLYNDNLEVLKDFGNRVSSYLFKTVNNETKCMVTGYEFSGTAFTYYQDVYLLPGNLPVGDAKEMTSSLRPPPFPNPTNSHILIPLSLSSHETTTLKIFNQNGQLIDSKQISGHENSLSIDVQNFSPGLYFYQYNNIKDKFIVTK